MSLRATVQNNLASPKNNNRLFILPITAYRKGPGSMTTSQQWQKLPDKPLCRSSASISMRLCQILLQCQTIHCLLNGFEFFRIRIHGVGDGA